MSQFTIEILEAINNWQRGSSHQQKLKRGSALKAAAQLLDERFRTCTLACYRQEAHEKDRVWQVLADIELPETIAAWTVDFTVAKAFKGGVPPVGHQGVIFRLAPPPSSVVLNLDEVYQDAGFLRAIEEHRSAIAGFGDGIGRYGNTQKEVVLELASLSQTEIYSYGGFSSDRETLAEVYFQRPPTTDDLQQFDALLKQSAIPHDGAWWLSHEATSAIIARMQPAIAALKLRKASEA